MAPTIGDLRATLAGREQLATILGAVSFLVDGVRADDTTPITTGALIDVLPPFAGGSAAAD